MKFSSTGALLLQWGTKGNGPGQFEVPHGIALDASGRVYVADRQNDRVQIPHCHLHAGRAHVLATQYSSLPMRASPFDNIRYQD